jgi:hypothetical protein
MKNLFSPYFQFLESEIKVFINNYETKGILFGDGKRNKIKLFELEGKTINIKSFKIPNLINKIAYKYYRKSKARRSFEFATILLEKGIGTPQPIAYFENYDFVGLNDSYYISEHLQCDLTFRELVEIPDYLDYSNILRQFTRFSFELHEKGIEFLDHSPGNTLIKNLYNGNYAFYLVDLNRMDFHSEMSFDSRMKNLSRLTPKKQMIEEIAMEYARLSGENPKLVFDTLWKYTSEFQRKHFRKNRIKKTLKFWKK